MLTLWCDLYKKAIFFCVLPPSLHIRYNPSVFIVHIPFCWRYEVRVKMDRTESQGDDETTIPVQCYGNLN